MDNNIETVKINDNGIEKTFIINKFKATKLFFFTNLLLGLLAETDNINVDTIRQFANSKLQSGVNVENVKPKDVEGLLQQDLLTLIFDVVKSVLANIDETKQANILTPLLNCITFINGSIPIKLTMLDNSPEHVDNYITDVAALYKLLWEVLKHNYAGFFTKGAS